MALGLLLVLFGVFSLALAAPTAHVILIIGQSNSVGLNSDGHTAEDVTYPNILQTSCCANGEANNDQCQLISGQDPLHHECGNDYLNSQNVGFGMSFARELRVNVPQDDLIVLVPSGLSGTGFVDNVWTAYTGRGFVQAVARVRSTFSVLSQKYPQHNATFAGILWHQGEADADVNTPTDEYLNKDIIPMINGLRDTALIPQSNFQVPFVVGNLVPGWVMDPNARQRLGVLVALQTLDQFVPYTMSTPSQGLVGASSLDIHFNAKSQRIFGKRYYAAWKLALLNYSVQ